MLPRVRDTNKRYKTRPSTSQMSLSLPKYGEKKTIYASCSAGTAESSGADWEDSQLPAERRALAVVNRKKNSYRKMEDSVASCSKRSGDGSVDVRLPRLIHDDQEGEIIVIDSEGEVCRDKSHSISSSSEEEEDPLNVLESLSVCSSSQDDLKDDLVERDSVATLSYKTTAKNPPAPEVVDLTSDGDNDTERSSAVPASPVGAVAATSSKDSSTSSTVSQISTLSERKRKKIVSRGDVFQGVHSVRDMTELQLRRWLYLKKPLMVDLFKGKEFSWRHENFSSGCRKRGALIHQMDSHHYKKEHVEIIVETLLHIFCGKDMKYFSYVMSVLLAECFIRIIVDVHKVTFEEAEKLMMDYSGKMV